MIKKVVYNIGNCGFIVHLLTQQLHQKMKVKYNDRITKIILV